MVALPSAPTSVVDDEDESSVQLDKKSPHPDKHSLHLEN